MYFVFVLLSGSVHSSFAKSLPIKQGKVDLL